MCYFHIFKIFQTEAGLQMQMRASFYLSPDKQKKQTAVSWCANRDKHPLPPPKKGQGQKIQVILHNKIA